MKWKMSSLYEIMKQKNHKVVVGTNFVVLLSTLISVKTYLQIIPGVSFQGPAL